jgi:hypothetical protein
MAKLEIDLDLKFQTEPLLVSQDFKEVNLDYTTGKSKFEAVNEDELKFEVICTNENCGGAFFFKKKDGKKGSNFSVEYCDDVAGLSVTVKGCYSVTLRTGADKMLKDQGAALDLRLRAVTWKGGAYMGFAAFVKGSDYEQQNDSWRETFPQIKSFSIK